MPASIVKLKGKWYVLLTTYDIYHRGEAEEAVATKLKNKRFPCRVFPMDSWGDAVVQGNALTDEFLDDWSMRDYLHDAVHSHERVVLKKARLDRKPAKVLPEWKEKLKGVKAKPSVEVVVKKRRKIEK